MRVNIRTIGFGLAAATCALLWGGTAAAQSCATYPYSFSTGTVAYASQVNANFACAALLGGPHFTGSVDLGGATEKLSLNSGSLGFNRRTQDGYIYNTSAFAYQFQHFDSTTPASDYLTLQVYTPTSTFVGNALTVNGAGQVSVGTTDPNFSNSISSAFTVNGAGSTAIAAGYSPTVAAFAINPVSNGGWAMFDHGGGAWNFELFGLNGSVGIGTTTPSMKLYVNGTAGGTSAWAVSSDARLKTNITPVTGALATVLQLQGVRYSFVAQANRTLGHDLMLPDGPQVGFIAQDVAKVVPEAVVAPADPTAGVYGLMETKLIPYLVEAIKAQQAEIATQQAEIATLQAQIAALQGTH